MKLPSWLRFLFTRKIPEGEYHELLKPGLKREFELAYKAESIIQHNREIPVKLLMLERYLEDQGDEPLIELKVAWLNEMVKEIRKYVGIPTKHYDWPTPENFQNPMGEKK